MNYELRISYYNYYYYVFNDKLTVAQIIKKFATFIEPEASMSYSQ
jgi:hypothetical protein